MTKKLLALLLAMSFVLCLLAGCGSTTTKTTKKVTDTDTAAAESAETAAATTAAETTAAESTDAAAGEAIPDLELPLTDGTSFTYWTGKPGGAVSTVAPNGYADYPHFQEAEKLTGVHLDFISYDFTVATEQFNLMIAAGDYPDIFGNFNAYYTAGDDSGVENDIIIPLEDKADLFPHYQKYRTSSKFLDAATTTSEGHITGFYELMSDFIGPFFGMMARGDWMESMGIDTPTTYDELHDMLVRFKDEKGCTSAIYLDENAVGSDNFLVAGYGIASTIATNAKESYWYLDGDTVMDGLTGDGYKSYLTMLHQWYTEGLISKDFISAAGAMSPDGMGEITSGNCGVFFNGAPMMSMYSANSTDPNLKIIGLPDPVQTAGEITHVDSTEYDFGAERMSISTKCSDPDLACKYCDFWFTDQGIQLANFGAEGVSCKVVDGKAEFTDLVLNNPKLAAGDAISFYTGRNSTPSWSSNSKLLVSFNEDEKNAFQVWADSRDNRDTYPYVAALTISEMEELSALASDYESYALECRDKFIVGDMDIDKDYASYEENIRSMGLTRGLEIKQDAYDRYMAK